MTKIGFVSSEKPDAIKSLKMMKQTYDSVSPEKADIIVTVKADANRLLAPTDWYSSRKSELGTAIPDSILADRKKIRDKVITIETEVAALKSA